jgi:O-antigen/teichoic acid export membrane protein
MTFGFRRRPTLHGGRVEDTGPKGHTGLVSSFGILLFGTLGSQVIGLVGLGLVSRRLGPNDIGDFAYATSVAAYFTLPLLPGLALLGVREVTSASPEARSNIIFELQLIATVNAVIAWIAMYLGAGLLTPTARSAHLLPIVGLSVIINTAGIGWALQALRQVRKLSAFTFLSQLAYLAVVLLLVLSHRLSITGYAWANVFGFLVGAILFCTSSWRVIGRPRLRGPRRAFGRKGTVRRTLRATLPLSTSAVMLQVYLYSAVVLLGILSTPAAVGEYNAASKLPLAMLYFSMVWGQVFFPHATELWNTNKQVLLGQVSHFATLAALMFVPLIPIAVSVGPDLLGALFGQSFRAGGLTFALLIGFSCLSMINVNITNLMLAAGDDRGFMMRALVAAVACVAFGLAMIPLWGPPGAAAAIVLAELAAIALALLRISRVVGHLPMPTARRVCGLLAALVVETCSLFACSHWAWAVRGSAAGLAYFAAAFALRALRRSDLRSPA